MVDWLIEIGGGMRTNMPQTPINAVFSIVGHDDFYYGKYSGKVIK